MWRMPKIHHEFVGLYITPTALITSWIQKGHSRHPYHIKAYNEIALPENVLLQGRIFHPTHVLHHIRSFIEAYDLEHAYIMCALEGPGVTESFISLESLDAPDMSSQNAMVLFRQYLYTYDDITKVFYQAGIKRECLAQYILLALRAQLNLVGLVPSFVPHLALYKRIHEPVFRHTQLASDMQQHNKQLYAAFTHEHIKRLLAPHTRLNQASMRGLVTSLGLFLLGSEYEKHQFY